MSIKIILRLLSMLLVLLSIPLAAPIGVAIIYGEPFFHIRAFLLPIGIAIGFFLFVRFGFGQKGIPNLSPKSGFLFVCLAWISASLVGCIPFMAAGVIPDFTHAYFETLGGFTTTGASVIADVDSIPRSLVFWRALTYWMGGMGIVVLTVAVFPLLGFGGLHLMEAETPGPTVNKLSPKIAKSAKILWVVYLGFTAALTLFLVAGGLQPFDAITRAMVTVSTGGCRAGSADAGYSSRYVQIILMIFMLLSGMNFSLHYKILTGKFRDLVRDSEWRLYLAIFIVVSALIAHELWRTGMSASLGDSLLQAGFHVASLLSTTGFYTLDFSAWGSLSQIFLLFLLFVGGCAGSTGGGIKVIRILTMFKMAVTEMKYLVYPRGVFGIFVNGQYLKKNIVYNCAALVFLYFIVFVAVAVVVATGGYDILTSLTTSLAFLSNTGVGFGRAAPFHSFDFLPPYIMWTLDFAMLIGRLEVYTFLVIFTPAFWKR
ncbi:MAG: TrkH family potassium uptake protein [Spirochaetales bacterium]|jgi:trk system potassium uptake protein TrkH|nr:TrkH family potassium uptake protein [Spirochaetales bacterium]